MRPIGLYCKVITVRDSWGRIKPLPRRLSSKLMRRLVIITICAAGILANARAQLFNADPVSGAILGGIAGGNLAAHLYGQ